MPIDLNSAICLWQNHCCSKLSFIRLKMTDICGIIADLRREGKKSFLIKFWAYEPKKECKDFDL